MKPAAKLLALIMLGCGLSSAAQTDLFRYSSHGIIEGGQGAIHAIAFESDGKLLAYSGKDGVIALLSLPEGKVVKQLTGHSRAVNSIAFRRDGRYLASASDDKTVRIWDLRDGSSRALTGHGGKVLDLAFSPSGDVLASAGEDKQVLLWSVETGANIGANTEHSKKITHLFFLKDESLLSIGEDRTIIEWDVKAKRVLRRWQESAPYITSAAANLGGNWLTLGTEDTALQKGGAIINTPGPGGLRRSTTIKVYSIDSGGLQKTFDTGSYEMSGLSISSDNNYLVAAHQGMTRSSLVVWDIKRGEQVAVIEQPTKDNLTAVAFSPDGQWLVSGNQSGKLSIWKTEGIYAAAAPPEDLRGRKHAFLTTREPLFSFRQPTTVGILDLDPLGIEPHVARIASEEIRARVSGSRNVKLIERQKIDRVLQEQKLEHSGATDPVTAARVGKVLNISKVAFGSLSRLGRNLIATVQLVDVETAAIEGIRQTTCNACTEEDLTEMVAFLETGLVRGQGASASTAMSAQQPGGNGTGPLIELIYPEEHQQFNLDEIIMKGLVTLGADLKSIEVEVSGQGGSRALNVSPEAVNARADQSKQIGNSYYLERAIALAPGANVITVTAQDKSGVTEQVSRVVYRTIDGASAPGPASRAQSRRWAFIVGISNYQDPKIPALKFAHRDAQDVSAFLQSAAGGAYPAENIVFLTNHEATWSRIREELREFARKPGPDDLVFFYFAAHGTPDPYQPENIYLVAYDTSVAKLAGTALSIREIELALRENLKARRVIMLADTCYSGAFGVSGMRAMGQPTDAINYAFNEAIRRSKPGTFVLTSALGNEVSQEGENWGGGHGVFTWYLLEGLKGKADTNGDGYVTADELFPYIYENVMRDTSGHQHPTNLSSEYDPKLPLANAPKSQ